MPLGSGSIIRSLQPRRRYLYEQRRVVLLAHSPRRDRPSSSPSRPVPHALRTRERVARGSPKIELYIKNTGITPAYRVINITGNALLPFPTALQKHPPQPKIVPGTSVSILVPGAREQSMMVVKRYPILPERIIQKKIRCAFVTGKG